MPQDLVGPSRETTSLTRTSVSEGLTRASRPAPSQRGRAQALRIRDVPGQFENKAISLMWRVSSGDEYYYTFAVR